MGTLKIASWNVEHLDRLTKENLNGTEMKRRDAVVREIRELSPDILCLVEGPKGEEAVDKVSNELLGGDWVAVNASDGEYAIQGTQWMWFFVRKEHSDKASLLPTSTWDALAGSTWPCHYWGEFQEQNHKHYRHPQTLILNWNGFRVEFIGLHLKSKFLESTEFSIIKIA